MGVLPQHGQQAEAGLKTLANAVELIAPERRGIDQQQSPQTKGQTDGHHHHDPAAFHRLRSCAALRCRRNSARSLAPAANPQRSGHAPSAERLNHVAPTAPPAQQRFPLLRTGRSPPGPPPPVPTLLSRDGRRPGGRPKGGGVSTSQSRSAPHCCSHCCCLPGICNRCATATGSAAPRRSVGIKGGDPDVGPTEAAAYDVDRSEAAGPTAAAPATAPTNPAHRPRFPLQQPLQLHPQSGRQSRRCRQRRISLAPGPGPPCNGAADLRTALLASWKPSRALYRAARITRVGSS